MKKGKKMKLISRLGLMGCGKMGSVLVRSIIGHRKDLSYLFYDINESASFEMMSAVDRDTAKVCLSEEELWNNSDCVLLALRPNEAVELLQRVASLENKPLIISVVAGLSYDRLCALSKNMRCIRTMPNIASLLGTGVIAIEMRHHNSSLSLLDYAFAKKVLNYSGRLYEIYDERHMDVVTALSGSGPGLFSTFIEAIVDAAVSEGLPRVIAEGMARDTMFGTASMLELKNAMELKAEVMSPGGTTAKGLVAAERAGLTRACMEFIIAASEHCRKISTE